MACQPEICALECELSDEDSFDPISAPIREIINAPRSRRKIVWMKVTEFGREAEAKIYVGDNWGHLRTNKTKIHQRRSEVFYCRLHGRSGCLTQSKYEHTPGGKFIVYQRKEALPSTNLHYSKDRGDSNLWTLLKLTIMAYMK